MLSENCEETASFLIQSSGLGGISPNILLMSWPDNKSLNLFLNKL